MFQVSSQWRNQGGQRGQLTPPKYLEGPALALEGPALALEGSALALEGPALALEGPALALEGPALALVGPALAWRARSGFEGSPSDFVEASLAF